MNKAKHTPGPWVVEESWNEPGRLTISAATTRTSLQERGLVCLTDKTSFREREAANARLIAAAPDLLAALDELLATHELREYKGERITPTEGSAMEQARAAIAKAVGN